MGIVVNSDDDYDKNTVMCSLCDGFVLSSKLIFDLFDSMLSVSYTHLTLPTKA